MVPRLAGFANLKTRVVLVVITLLLGSLALLTARFASVQRQEMEQLLMAQQASVTSFVAYDIEGKLQGRLLALKRVAQNIPAELYSDPKGLEKWLVDRRAIYTLFDGGLIIARPNGDGAFADYPPLPGRRSNRYDDRDWFLAARDSGQPTIGRPIIGRATLEPTLVMAIPVYTRNHTLAFVVAGVTRLSSPGFLDTIQNIKMGRNGDFLLIAPRHGLSITATDPALTMRPLTEWGNDETVNRYMSGRSGSAVTRNRLGVTELSSGTAIPSADWMLVARLPSEEAFAPIVAARNQLYWAAALIALPLGGLIWLLLYFLLRPLDQATVALRMMAQGKTPLHPLAPQGGSEIGKLVSSFNDLQSVIHHQNEEMRHQAHHDPLTALPNRVLYLDRLTNVLAVATQHNTRLAVLFLDLDRFKPINDQYGHETGDQLLVAVARRLRESIRHSDTLARFGGDEFVLLLPDIKDTEDALRIGQKCIQALKQPLHINGTELTVGISIGVALYPEHGKDVDSLIAQADAAMYRAKLKQDNKPCLAIAQ